MNRNLNLYRMVMAALLCAVGIVVPMVSIRIPIGPFGSFTLASHVAIFIAMYFSPLTAVMVCVGTTIGFQMTMPLPIVLRAATHIVWAALGALWLKKHPGLLSRPGESALFCGVIAVIHALCEVLVCIPLFLGGQMVDSGGLFLTLIVSVGFVTLIHSTVDFIISVLVWKPLRHVSGVSSIAAAD